MVSQPLSTLSEKLHTCIHVQVHIHVCLPPWRHRPPWGALSTSPLLHGLCDPALEAGGNTTQGQPPGYRRGVGAHGCREVGNWEESEGMETQRDVEGTIQG